METPKIGHAPIKMRRVRDNVKRDNVNIMSELEKPGDFYWVVDRDGLRSLVLALPSNWPEHLGQKRLYSRWTIAHKNHCGASWDWNGDEDRPTLSPSLHQVGDWHGRVQSGVMIEA